MTDESSIAVTHLRRELSAVLDAVLQGRTVRVERHGRPLCVLVPAEAYAELQTRAEQASHLRNEDR